MLWLAPAHLLALLTLALTSEAAPPPNRLPRLTDVTAASGIDFVHVNGPSNRKDYIFEAKGGGVGALDYDNDGWMDLLFAQGSTLERVRAGRSPTPALYRNRRDGTFENVTERAGLTHRGWGMGVAAADYDNDGWTDLYLTYLGPDVLYRNNGDGTFTDVTKEAGIDASGWSASAAFGDFDGDGFLDLYVASYLDVGPNRLPEGRAGGTCSYIGVPVLCGPRGLPGAIDRFFRGNGDGTFSEQSAASGAADPGRYFGLGVVAADFDDDGDLDLYVGNDATPNYLFANLGGGRFEERGLTAGVAVSGEGNEQASMGLDAADYDNDGRLDLYAAHFAHDSSTLYRNLGDLLFADVTLRARVLEPENLLVAWGMAFVDLDNDGWKDIVHANGHVYPHLRGAKGGETYEQPALTIYRNTRDGTFTHASAEAGPDAVKPVVGRGTAFGDLDNDGDTDVAIACLDSAPLLLRNEGVAGTHWLMLRAAGRKSNRDGIGTRITVHSGGLSQTWEVKRTVGIYSSSDPRAHFGLGAATKADLVRVRWPSGKVDEFRDVPADRHYLVDEADGLSAEPILGRTR
ncbi:MAG: CRTAC1 family protein [Acidobacteria bacterium]|nr:CRTAC1 family protein [Acidobacteriota bacterium]